MLLSQVRKQRASNYSPHPTSKHTREHSDSSGIDLSDDSDSGISPPQTPYLKDSFSRTLDTWQRRRTLQWALSQGYEGQIDHVPCKVTNWNRCILNNGQISQCKLAKRSSHKNARNSCLIRYKDDTVRFAEVQFYFSINLHQMHRPTATPQKPLESDSDSDSKVDSNTANPIQNLAYIRLLSYDHDGSLLYTTKVSSFQVICISDIQEIIGLIKNKQRLYIVNGSTSSWDYLDYGPPPLQEEDEGTWQNDNDIASTQDDDIYDS